MNGRILAGLLAMVALGGAAGAETRDIKALQQARFPQPVRVGDMVGWPVIEPGSQLKRLGQVVGVFRTMDGQLQLVFRYGGVFGLGGRVIAPDIEEVDLVGPMVKVTDLDRKDLAALPTFTGAGGAFLKPDEEIKLGVDRKY
jgi:hypothetical protein